MKEQPILFNTLMVQRHLEGRKTMTRRVVKTQPIDGKFSAFKNKVTGEVSIAFRTEKTLNHTIYCPFGKIGDVLWVRETFFDCSNYTEAPLFQKVENMILYKADNAFIGEHKWKPSIHMPRKACRLKLQLINISAEPLQNISEEDSIKEGCFKYGPFGEYAGSLHPSGGAMKYRAYQKASSAFKCIWESVYGEQSWKANKIVWVLEYKIIS